MFQMWLLQFAGFYEAAVQIFSESCAAWYGTTPHAGCGAAWRRSEAWIEAVEPDRDGWGRQPAVCNCAARLYTAESVNLVRLPVANAADYGASRCCCERR